MDVSSALELSPYFTVDGIYELSGYPKLLCKQPWTNNLLLVNSCMSTWRTGARMPCYHFIKLTFIDGVCMHAFFIKVLQYSLANLGGLHYYRRNRPFKSDLEFRVQEIKGRLFFMHFLKVLHEKQSAFRFLDSEFRVQFERPIALRIMANSGIPTSGLVCHHHF